MAAVLPTDLAQAMQYGPQTQQAIRRSQYLADALKQSMDTQAAPIKGGWGELGARLLASAILNRATDKAQLGTLDALRSDQSTQSQNMLSSLDPSYAASLPPAAPAAPPQQQGNGILGAIGGLFHHNAPPAQPAPQTATPSAPPPQPEPQPQPLPAAQPDTQQTAPAPAPAPVMAAAPPPTPTPAPQQAGLQVTPQDRDAAIRMVATEAAGEGPVGMAAAAHVALNRLKAGYGGAKSLHDVIYQPHQFEGITRGHAPSQAELAAASHVVDGVLSGQLPDPTGGAQAFLNPVLQTQLGRNIPKWAQGPGQRIGNHVFFGGQPQQQAQNGVPPPPPPPDPNGPPVQNVQPYQVASNGATPPPPSASVRSPPTAGTAAPDASPQAPSGAATPATPQWPMQKPSHAELDEVAHLLADPRTFAAGQARYFELQHKKTQPVPSKIVQMNGLSFYVPDVPGEAPTIAIPVPKEAMTHTVGAQAAGLTGAPQGLNVQVDPFGNMKDAPGAPPPGYEVGPGGQLHYRAGGPDDPTRPQAPPQGYRYTGTGQQEFIPGSTADPRTPANLIAGTQSVQKEIRPLVDLAVVARQSFGAVQTGFHQQNGAGDIAMVNGLQHLIDKGVVRGEDVNMQMKSNGLTGSVGSLSQYLQSGGLLTPEIRQRVLKTATDLYANVDQTYRGQVLGYRDTVDASYGKGSFDKYVLPPETQKTLGWNQPTGAPPANGPAPGPAGTPTAGTADAALMEAAKRGLPLSQAQRARVIQLNGGTLP